MFYICVSFGVSAGFGIEFSLDLSYVNGLFQDWSFRPYDSFTVDIGLLFALQVGFGVKGFVELFGRGAITLDLVFTISMNSPPTIVITLVGDATAGITIFFVTFTRTWNFFKEQLYPPESVSNLLAFFMHQGDEEPTSREPAYGEPFSYPWLVEKAKEELPPNPGFVNYWAAGDYKVVRAKNKMYIFYIGTANNPDGVSHKRLAWNLMDGDTNLEVHGSLQSVIDSDEAKAATQGDVEWITAINRRDDYAFDVFGHGDYIYIVTTCAREFDKKGCPVANDLTDRSSLKNTLSSVALSVRGKVRELGYGRIPDLFEKNPYMHQIYPTDESMRALTVFQVYEGTGEWFDLSKKPIERAAFTFGGAEKKAEGYFISDACIGCGKCTEVCPQSCIEADGTQHMIRQEHCLHCGNCLDACPVGAVERR